MLDAQLIQDISKKIRELANASPAGDLERNIHALLQGMFTKLELVSREEFDVQAMVLKNTRDQLERLEARLAALEAAQHRELPLQ